jgi:hypothetical protein
MSQYVALILAALPSVGERLLPRQYHAKQRQKEEVFEILTTERSNWELEAFVAHS